MKRDKCQQWQTYTNKHTTQMYTHSKQHANDMADQLEEITLTAVRKGYNGTKYHTTNDVVNTSTLEAQHKKKRYSHKPHFMIFNNTLVLTVQVILLCL